LSKPYYPNPHSKTRMPERQTQDAQTKGGNGWWGPLAIGLLLLIVPGGAFVAPIFFILAVIMRKRSKSKSPETSPSLITLI